MRKKTPKFITTLKPPYQVIVFGSDLAGKHKKGAALQAAQLFGAKYGQGAGHHGQTYALPTKDEYIRRLPIEEIVQHIKLFLNYAMMNAEYEFFVTRIGCGLAGYEDEEIAPFFFDAPLNVRLPERWIELENEHNEAQKAAIAARG